MGDYGSPQIMGASAEAAAPMVAVQADQGLPSGTGQRAPGIGPDGRVVVVQTKLPLRQGDRLTSIPLTVMTVKAVPRPEDW